MRAKIGPSVYFKITPEELERVDEIRAETKNSRAEVFRTMFRVGMLRYDVDCRLKVVTLEEFEETEGNRYEQLMAQGRQLNLFERY